MPKNHTFNLGRWLEREMQTPFSNSTWMAVGNVKRPQAWAIANSARLAIITCAVSDVTANSERTDRDLQPKVEMIMRYIMNRSPQTPSPVEAEPTRIELVRDKTIDHDFSCLRVFFDTEDGKNDVLGKDQEAARSALGDALEIEPEEVDLVTPYITAARIRTEEFIEGDGERIAHRLGMLLGPSVLVGESREVERKLASYLWPKHLTRQQERSPEAGAKLFRYVELLGHVASGNVVLPQPPYPL